MKVSTNNIVLIFIALSCYLFVEIKLLFFINPWIIFAVQCAFLCLAWSEYGSCLLRLIYGVQRVQTQRDKERLQPIFISVMAQTRFANEGYYGDIKLYIDNSNEVNAYAMGRNSIVITRGALLQLTDEQIKGILAHEVGHIFHGDTFVLLFLLIGNFIFLFFIGLFKLVQYFFDLVAYTIGGENMRPKLINLIFGTFATLSMLVVQLLLMMNQRTNEYNADHFALEIGYGQQLVDSLYYLSNLQVGQKQSMFERLKMSHPNIYDRIEVMENKMNTRDTKVYNYF